MRIALPAVAFQFIVRRDVAWLLGPFSLLLIGLEDGGLHYFASGRVDRMGDIGMELGPAVGVASGPILVELMAALIAVAGPQMVFAAALRAPVGEFAARHGHERPLAAFDVLQIANDEHFVKRDRAESQEPFVVGFHELDWDLGEFLSCSPFLSVATSPKG